MKKLVALTTVAAMALCAFAGCSTEETVDTEVSTDASAAAPGEDAGFTELPIFEDVELDFINLSAVYFQPVPMSNGIDTEIAAEDYDLHLEADISALENDLGYGVGDLGSLPHS